MDFEDIKLTDIVPAEYNPRRISESEFEKLKSSISEFGLVDPIIINLNNNKIIGGHQRYDVLMNEHINNNDKYDSLKLIKLGDIGWVFCEEDLIIKDDSHEKALNIALNKISGSWDNEKLQELFVDLELDDFDLDLTGFDSMEIAQLGFDDNIEFFDEENLEEEDDFDKDEFDEVKIEDYEGQNKCPKCGYEWDE